jgi:hypothetical protein
LVWNSEKKLVTFLRELNTYLSPEIKEDPGTGGIATGPAATP